MSFWNDKQVIKLLSLIIFTQYPKGKPPDYDFLAEHLGATRDGVKKKFSRLRQEFEAQDHTAVGAREPVAKKRTKKEPKEEFYDDEEDKKPVKRSRSAKGATKAEN
jgi:hypothetical protein